MGPAPHPYDLDLVNDLAVDDQLRAFVDDLRSTYVFGPPPETTARLATVLARGLAGGGVPDERLAAVPPPAQPIARRTLADWLQSRRLRLGLGAAAAGLTIFSTGAAGALPGPVQSVFERSVEVVGIDLPKAAQTPEPGPMPAESTPTVPPSNGSGAEPPGPPPAEPGTPDGQTGSSPLDTGPGAPMDGGPSEDGTGGTPGNPAGRDARPGLSGEERRRGAGPPANGAPAPVAPGPPEHRPGSGPPDGLPGPDGGDGEESRRPGPPDGAPGASGLGASGPGQLQASDPAAVRGLR